MVDYFSDHPANINNIAFTIHHPRNP